MSLMKCAIYSRAVKKDVRNAQYSNQIIVPNVKMDIIKRMEKKGISNAIVKKSVEEISLILMMMK